MIVACVFTTYPNITKGMLKLTQIVLLHYQLATKFKVLKIFIISMPYKAKVMSEESFVLS